MEQIIFFYKKIICSASVQSGFRMLPGNSTSRTQLGGKTMNTISDYSKIVLAILAVSSVSIPVASQAGSFSPAMRDGGHRGTAAVRPSRQYRGSAARYQRRAYRSGVSVRSGRRYGYSRAYQSRPYARHSGRYYARHNRPSYRHGSYYGYRSYYRPYYAYYRPYYRAYYGYSSPYYYRYYGGH